MSDASYIVPSIENFDQTAFSAPDHGATICAKLDKIIELLELQVGIAVAEDEPEEVDRGHLDA